MPIVITQSWYWNGRLVPKYWLQNLACFGTLKEIHGSQPITFQSNYMFNLFYVNIIARYLDSARRNDAYMQWWTRPPLAQIMDSIKILSTKNAPDSKVHGANMGPTWVLSAPDGPHVGPMNLATRDHIRATCWQKSSVVSICVKTRGQCCWMNRDWPGSSRLAAFKPGECQTGSRLLVR